MFRDIYAFMVPVVYGDWSKLSRIKVGWQSNTILVVFNCIWCKVMLIPAKLWVANCKSLMIQCLSYDLSSSSEKYYPAISAWHQSYVTYVTRTYAYYAN